MQLKRLNAGHYVVSNGDDEVTITKDLGRSWNIIPPAGSDLPRMKAENYADAKTAASEMLTPAQAKAAERIFVKPKSALQEHLERLQLIACEMIDAVEVLKRQGVK